MRWAKVGILGAVLFVCFAAIAVLGFEVNRKINDEATASSDNVQWVLSQLEVEFLTFQNTIETTDTIEELKDVRRRFDILYSRVSTFKTGRAYDNLRNDLAFGQRLAGLVQEMDNAIPLIDGPDPELLAGLPELLRKFDNLTPVVRQMALIGIEYFAKEADASRAEVWLTLMRVAALTLALVMALIILSVVLFQLYRVAQTNTEETKATSARLEAMVASTLDAVIVINESGRIVEYNGAAEYVFGYNRIEAIGAPLVDLVIPMKYRRAHMEGMKRHLRDGSSHVVGRGRVQMEAMRKNGELFPCEFTIARANTASGTLFVSFLRDNSAQVAAETELMKARDDALAGERTKAEFMAVMSHEMRTPLNGMLGTMELLGETGLNDRQKMYLRIMQTSGRLLLHHVNDVLDIARLDAGKTDAEKRPFNLDMLVEEIVEGQRSLAHANRTEVEIDLSALSHPTVLGDQQRLRQVLLNLISNAIKFTTEGIVRIEAEKLGDNDLIEFRVIDSGIGISEEDIDRIFEDFVTLDASYSRSSGGTGLGLGIAKRLVESMDGAIGAESEKNEGSLFWFRIPLPILSSEPVARQEIQITESIPEFNPVRQLEVLVVEDNQINQLVVEEMLRKEGHKVTLANDGEEGVAAAAMRRYDLILMDISMPRMDGVSACMAIREGDGRSRDSRIIALTANALPEDIERFKASGMNDVLVKPISRTKLARALSSRSMDQATLEMDLIPSLPALDAPVVAEPALPVVAEPIVAAEPVKAPKVEIPSAPAQRPPALDHDMVISLLGDLGVELGPKLLGNFLTETETVVRGFLDAPNPDDKELIAEIHKLAGSSAMFGTLALSGHLRALETLGKTGKPDVMRERLPELDGIWAETREELELVASDLMDDDDDL